MEKIQYVIIGISGIFLLWFLAPLVVKGIVNVGSVTGVLVFLLLLLYGIFMKRVNGFLASVWSRRGGRIFLTAAVIVAAGILITALTETFFMVKTVLHVPPENTPAVVLGCSVKGTRPSRILEERLEAAYDYLKENPEAVCILSGGQGPGEDISEAQCMYEYLTAKGIDGARLFLEDQSTTTEENLAFSKEILEKEQLGSRIAVVTSDFHAYRADMIAASLNLEGYSAASHTAWIYLPIYYVRELYAILEQWFLK